MLSFTLESEGGTWLLVLRKLGISWLGPAGKSHFTVPGPCQILNFPESRREWEKGRRWAGSCCPGCTLAVLCRPGGSAAHPCTSALRGWGSTFPQRVPRRWICSPRSHTAQCLFATSPHLLQQCQWPGISTGILSEEKSPGLPPVS